MNRREAIKAGAAIAAAACAFANRGECETLGSEESRRVADLIESEVRSAREMNHLGGRLVKVGSFFDQWPLSSCVLGWVGVAGLDGRFAVERDGVAVAEAIQREGFGCVVLDLSHEPHARLHAALAAVDFGKYRHAPLFSYDSVRGLVEVAV